jgi:serine kinase of HPr protein (carbohydrate metabolism regulator)
MVIAVPPAMTESIHATCVEVAGLGVLLLGKPGSGKSDFALRLIDQRGSGIGEALMAACLVADDQTLIEANGDALYASAPPATAGKLEVRGIGIVEVPHVARTRVSLAVELVNDRGLERMPDLPMRRQVWLGVALPVVRLAPFEASAPAKLRVALRTVIGPVVR